MSTVFGIDRATVRSAVEGVTPAADLDDDAVATRFAHGAWSALAEPGDPRAGALVAHLGAAPALTAFVDDDHSVAPGADLAAVFARWLPRRDAAAVLAAFHNARAIGAGMLVPGDPLWPSGLADLGVRAPAALWWRGDGAALRATARSVAVVGSRTATDYGTGLVWEAVPHLVRHSAAIVSGAAYGIDGAAHRAALHESGTTVAVIAGGIDRLYPSGHVDLLHRIAERGAVVAESVCGVPPTKWRFLQRNRLIAAITGATVVVEAGARSGALNTARTAAEIGRPVGAFPGPVHSAESAGCHVLFRDAQAVCVRHGADVLELIQPIGQPELDGPAALDGEDGPSERRVLDALRRRPRSPLEVARAAGMSVDEVLSTLGLLEAVGRASRQAAGWVRA